MDTFFVEALLNQNDSYHEEAKQYYSNIRSSEIWITEAILIEIGNALSRYNRDGFVKFFRQCYKASNMRIIPIDNELLKSAANFYDMRKDKEWGLTDCISFVVMKQYGLIDALTADHHFEQAGFRPLLVKTNK